MLLIYTMPIYQKNIIGKINSITVGATQRKHIWFLGNDQPKWLIIFIDYTEQASVMRVKRVCVHI